jgi:hypothetical protein
MSIIGSIEVSKALFSKTTEQPSKVNQDSTIGTSSESSEVKLGKDAMIFAKFAQKGISVSIRKLDHALSPQNVNQSSVSSVGIRAYEKSISMDDLDKVLLNLGASEVEIEQIESGLDIDNNGNISHDELLRGLAGTLDNGNSLSKSILNIMDRNGDSNGTVNAVEFSRLATALYDTEK